MKSRASIRKGFQHIKDEAPRGNFDSEQLEWAECELNDPESPIFGWRYTLINQALAIIKVQANLAKKEIYYPLTLFDLNKDMLKIIFRVLPRLRVPTALCVGEAGCAETPLNTVLAMCMARYWAAELPPQEVNGFRRAADLDFSVVKSATRYAPASSMTTILQISDRRRSRPSSTPPKQRP